MDLWTPLNQQKKVKEIFIRYYGQYFSSDVGFDKRIDVRPDTLVYNREDRYVWDQSKGKVPNYYTVYFDDVYICGFGEDEPQQKIDLEFWKGMQKAYKADKIRLNKGLAQQIKDERDKQIKDAVAEANKKLDDLPEVTPVQKLAKEAVRRVKNAKNNKPPITS